MESYESLMRKVLTYFMRQMQEEVMWWKAMPRSLPWNTPKIISTTLILLRLLEAWRRGSVVGSWLLDLTADVLRHDHDDLNKFDGGVSDSGEGRWTLHAAVDLGVPTPVISAALFERFNSRKLGRYANKILNGMRYMFGGHNVR